MSFDSPTRSLLLATSREVYGLAVDRLDPESKSDADPQLLMGGGLTTGPQLDGGAEDATLAGVVGLAVDADARWYVVEQVAVQSARRRGLNSHSGVRLLQLPAAAGDVRPAANGGAARGDGGGGGGDGGGEATLATLATAFDAAWRCPCVLPSGCLALIDEGSGITLLDAAVRPQGLPLPAAGAHTATGAAVVGSGAGGGAASLLRSLAADLGALLESCQGPGSGDPDDSGGGGTCGGGGLVTLAAAGGHRLRAHAAILQARCDYFRALLSGGAGGGEASGGSGGTGGGGGGWGDSGSRVLGLPDAPPEALMAALRHIYTGSTDVATLLAGPGRSSAAPPPSAPATAASALGRGDRAAAAAPGEASLAPLQAVADVAEVADQLLLPQLGLAAQRLLLVRCAAAPGAHLVPALLWAESRGAAAAELLEELKEAYLDNADWLAAAEAVGAGAGPGVSHGRRKQGRSHGGSVGGSGEAVTAAAAGGGPRRLAAESPALAAELEGALRERKRSRA
ncbi:hypothetical protein GPECTOR_5g274 [Gonium pectorale]|uniref:BTB domain-containing protein n=1 Tax=Gonium pectorale TaxID=33097 RepID=A0A150GWX1_GONPE|nr:hypothetical protein GPECTOR_5g274 [Gonium pectorale]|eukprot:KXZ54178.1 hypothetical protein GPECTOR_5g274 [Gonium pectorale]